MTKITSEMIAELAVAASTGKVPKRKREWHLPKWVLPVFSGVAIVLLAEFVAFLPDPIMRIGAGIGGGFLVWCLGLRDGRRDLAQEILRDTR
jgi:hypothetical protein